MQTLAPTETPTAGATPAGSSNRIVFGLSERQGEAYQYPGVYLLDPATRQTKQIFGAGVRVPIGFAGWEIPAGQ